jgi:hypothetical protein
MEHRHGKVARRERALRNGRFAFSAFMIAGLAVAMFFATPRAWAAGMAQVETELNEAIESVEAQEGLDEPDGQTNDSLVNEAQEGVDELEGPNNDGEFQLALEGQEGVDELEGPNNDGEFQLILEGQEGVDEPDGQNGESDSPESS